MCLKATAADKKKQQSQSQLLKSTTKKNKKKKGSKAKRRDSVSTERTDEDGSSDDDDDDEDDEEEDDDDEEEEEEESTVATGTVTGTVTGERSSLVYGDSEDGTSLDAAVAAAAALSSNASVGVGVSASQSTAGDGSTTVDGIHTIGNIPLSYSHSYYLTPHIPCKHIHACMTTYIYSHLLTHHTYLNTYPSIYIPIYLRQNFLHPLRQKMKKIQTTMMIVLPPPQVGALVRGPGVPVSQKNQGKARRGVPGRARRAGREKNKHQQEGIRIKTRGEIIMLLLLKAQPLLVYLLVVGLQLGLGVRKTK